VGQWLAPNQQDTAEATQEIGSDSPADLRSEFWNASPEIHRTRDPGHSAMTNPSGDPDAQHYKSHQDIVVGNPCNRCEQNCSDRSNPDLLRCN